MTNGTKWVFFCMTSGEVHRSHREQHFKYQHAAKVAIVTLPRLIHSEAGTHHSLRFSHNLFFFSISFLMFSCSSFLLLLRSHSIVPFVTHNPHCGEHICETMTTPSTADEWVCVRPPKYDKKTENLWICYVFRILCLNFSGKYSCTFSHTIFNGPDRLLHA